MGRVELGDISQEKWLEELEPKAEKLASVLGTAYEIACQQPLKTDALSQEFLRNDAPLTIVASPMR